MVCNPRKVFHAVFLFIPQKFLDAFWWTREMYDLGRLQIAGFVAIVTRFFLNRNMTSYLHHLRFLGNSCFFQILESSESTGETDAILTIPSHQPSLNLVSNKSQPGRSSFTTSLTGSRGVVRKRRLCQDWDFSGMGVSKNRGKTPKWMVKIMENPT